MATMKIHPTAVVDEGATIGPGTKIWHFCHVCAGATVGANCSLGQNVYVAPTAKIGDGAKIQNNVSLYDGVVLEDDVFCGPSMVFTNVLTPRAHVSRRDEYAPTLVKRGVTIGANATIVCGRTIGEYAFIGAGAVVTKDVLPHAVMLGNPARRKGWACRCGEMLRTTADDRARCARCGDRYAIREGRLAREE
ncbi:MAG: N-acetyltransferase [Myxococcales bacterium]|nr:MAG: N-acetyltransferase [Myxococcales bacterium]